MEIDVFCITPDEELFSQIRENSASCKRWAKHIEAHDVAAVLVGGAPSLRSRLESIKARQDNGQKVFALNGACKFLNDNGITPDYQVLLDPQPLLTDYIGHAKEYLVASQCHPSIFAALPNATLWHLCVDGAEEQIPDNGEDLLMVGGGVTVGLTSMCLAYALGYRNIHCYGYDSSSTEAGDHAFPTPIKGLTQNFDAPSCRAMVGLQKFTSTLCLVKQAQKFPKLCDDLIDLGCTVTLDCDGLLWALVQQNKLAAQAA